MKNSEILKQARRKIASGNQRYICYAIEEVDGATGRQRLMLARWVTGLLGAHESYESWLRAHHPQFYIRNGVVFDGAQKGRLQWIDWMIRHQKAQGQ